MLLDRPPDSVVTPGRVLAVLAFYGAIFLVAYGYRRSIEPVERKTFVAIGLVWAVSVFIANYLLYLVGAMSYLPWVTNFLHTFVWIGFVLTWLYFGVREKENLAVQCVLFTFFSLVVKYWEQQVFGTWGHDGFFGIDGNTAYILGWSIADGTYPVLTLLVLRLAAKRIPGLVAI
ncbi:MAG TPA: hypothetical protein VFI54_23485 [Solirubrobacteraceae bacterium]|nr:hypothetical protein [Solirubrobacteraceae bacterium]